MSISSGRVGRRGTGASCRSSRRRSELIGIVDWRQTQLEATGVRISFNTYAEAADILAEEPDFVFVATGGLPIRKSSKRQRTGAFELGCQAISATGRVLIFDDNGGHPGMRAAKC